MEDNEEDLTRLVQQLAGRVQGVELDAEVVQGQVSAFKAAEEQILKKMVGKGASDDQVEDPVAKLSEEMKSLPSRVAERLADFDERSTFRRRRSRRMSPMMLDEVLHASGGDPISILMAASLVRDDAPWLYELSTEVYRAAQSNDARKIHEELVRLERFSETMFRGPYLEELSLGDKDTYLLLREYPRFLHHALSRLRAKSVQVPRTLRRRVLPKPANATPDPPEEG
ncbi:MAG TPA: hypothetical protein VHW60_04435 [Caulobacteraceae bacterium]|jgi:hypothetical protein|nr:hypothetical protein [Caulobacteraceae bacterium]